jgi:hypothetical protein
MPTLDTTKLDNRFRKLFQDGKLVQVHVSKWSMSHQLTKEDLGLEDEVEETKTDEAAAKGFTGKVADFMTLGKKHLFTNEVRNKFGQLESRARKFLRDNSHRFPVADAHFVPQKSLVRVLTGLAKFKEEYDTCTTDFITNYEKHRQEMFEKYPDHKAMLEPLYPPVEDLPGKFSMSISVFEVAFPRKLKNMNMEEILAQNLAVEQAQKKYEVQMDQQYHNSLRQMEDFVKESARTMRNEVVRTFEVIAAKIQNREVVSATNLGTLKSVIESFDALDFLNDQKVKDRLAEVKKLVSSGADFKSDAEALARLQAAVTTTLETARNMSDIDDITGGYIRNLDIGDL